mgnify:FL=1
MAPVRKSGSPEVRSQRQTSGLLLLLLLTGCAGSRVAVFDAVTGDPISADVRSLDGGRLLVSAEGYEMRIVSVGERVELPPLWQQRLAQPGAHPIIVKPAADRPCCPGMQAR